MSAAFRLQQKKKFTQHDLRRLMNEQKAAKAQETASTRIDSPLAKYNDLGQLTCILCQSIVRSEAVWKVHINSKAHKENIALAKELKKETQNFTKPASKRPATPPPAAPNKKLKGILKNSSAKPGESGSDEEDKKPSNDSDLPEDFFDDKPSLVKRELVNINRGAANKKDEKAEAPEDEKSEALPDGFFDDPKKDAKAHNREFKDPVEEEWERFQKEIKEATDQATDMINEEQEEATVERQIEDIDEQLRIWTKILEIEKKTEEVVKQGKTKTNAMDDGEKGESSDEDMDVDEFLDWRAKKSHK